MTSTVLFLRLVGLAILFNQALCWLLPSKNHPSCLFEGIKSSAPRRTLVSWLSSSSSSSLALQCDPHRRHPCRQHSRLSVGMDDPAMATTTEESQRPQQLKSKDELVTAVPSMKDDEEPKNSFAHEKSCTQIPLEDLPFDDTVWNIYEESMADIMKQPRVVRKEDPIVVERCREFLLSRRGISPVSIPIHQKTTTTIVEPRDTNRGRDRTSFRVTLQEQGKRFQHHYNLTVKEDDFLTRCLVYMGEAWAGRNGIHPISVAWRKMKETGIRPKENSISTYMYILSKSNQMENHTDDNALLELAACHDLLYEPNEKIVTVRLKRLIGSGDLGIAEEILAALDDDVKRLRTFMPLMEYYCLDGDGASILRLFRQMQNSPSVHWDADSYSLVLASLARFGYFCTEEVSSSQHRPIPIEDALAANFSSTQGPELFDDLATEIANEILELSESAAIELIKGFQDGFIRNTLNDSDRSHGFVIQKVQIPSTGVCPLTGAKLRLLSLADIQRQHVHDTLLEMARLQCQQFVWDKMNKAKNKAITEDADGNRGYEELLLFSEWLDSREGDPFTAIVDGANVAYYGHKRVHYSNVKLLVEQLEGMGERPLVVMPVKYVQPIFHTSSSITTQKLSDKDLEVIEWLEGKGILFPVPRQCLDDYYWMLASVSNQTKARQHADLNVPLGDEQGRFPGMRPMLVTNDKMRDHKLELLEPREFRRWCSCHIVNYHISAYKENEWIEEREVIFSPADFFSREVQGNVLDHGKGKVWHFPVTNMEECDWLCVYIDR